MKPIRALHPQRNKPRDILIGRLVPTYPNDSSIALSTTMHAGSRPMGLLHDLVKMARMSTRANRLEWG